MENDARAATNGAPTQQARAIDIVPSGGPASAGEEIERLIDQGRAGLDALRALEKVRAHVPAGADYAVALAGAVDFSVGIIFDQIEDAVSELAERAETST
jgi:hypothetical protein